MLASFWKFPVKKNDKTPACRWKDPAKHQKEALKPYIFNTGIPTGVKNNLLVVDIDVKDDGLAEFKKYIEEHGDINTFIVETPTGGFHYYFNYSHAEPEQESCMRDYRKTTTKFREVM